jgi:hypothetical protein
VATEILDAEDSPQHTMVDEAVQVQVIDAEHSDQVLDEKDLPQYEPVDEEDTVPVDTDQDLTKDEALGHQAFQDEAQGNEESQNLAYSGGTKILAAEDLAAENVKQVSDTEVQQVLTTQQVLAAEDLAAQEVQQVLPIQQVLVAEDLAIQETQRAQQHLGAEDYVQVSQQKDGAEDILPTTHKQHEA